MNIPIAHIQGGEISGSIDESARHAITKFAHLHLASTQRAADYICRMGENPDYVFNVGCPTGDYILQLNDDLTNDLFDRSGVGVSIDVEQPFLLVIFHPVTTEFHSQGHQTIQLIQALHELSIPTIWIWPNIDAGSDLISKAIRVYREHNEANWLYLIKNLDLVNFQKMLKQSACAVGNSSSFIRDSTFSGTPVVLVGDRQNGREHGRNLVVTNPVPEEIVAAVRRQLDHGRYEPDTIYGDGKASLRIVDKLKSFVPYSQKSLHYWRSDGNPVV